MFGGLHDLERSLASFPIKPLQALKYDFPSLSSLSPFSFVLCSISFLDAPLQSIPCFFSTFISFSGELYTSEL